MKLVVIRGLPGSGKTTLGKQIAEQINGHYLDNDMWFGNEYHRWSNRLNKYAIEWCKGVAARHLFQGYSVVVANTFTKLAYIDEWFTMADVFEADFSVREPDTSWKFNPQECYHKTLHGVPLEHIQDMLDYWEEIPEGRYDR